MDHMDNAIIIHCDPAPGIVNKQNDQDFCHKPDKPGF